MAQTRRRRRSKHRGTAAGTIETRGRTGRKPTSAEKGSPVSKEERRQARLGKPPSWRSSFQRALLATVVFDALAVVALKLSPAGVIPFTVFVVAIYTVFGYAFDSALHKRRQRKKAQTASPASRSTDRREPPRRRR